MACLQPPCLSSMNTKLSPPKPTLFPRTHYLKPFKISSSPDSSPYPPENLSTNGQSQNPNGTAPVGDGGEGAKEIPEAVRVAMERAREYKRNKGLGKGQVISQVGQTVIEPANRTVIEPGNGDGGEGTKPIPDAVMIAMEKAREYKMKKGMVIASDGDKKIGNNDIATGLKGGNSGNGLPEKKAVKPISSLDFLGLNFADKKPTDRLPAGLLPIADPFPDDYFPEVELIVGDARRFGKQTMSEPAEQLEEEDGDIEEEEEEEEEVELYAPKVSTWGVFPRPKNISKAYGGGRTIRPGDVLETEEKRIAKNERTRRLIEEYRSKAAYTIDPKIKAECEQAMEDGDILMDAGKLKSALPYYQKVIDGMPFPTELHGRAALQWSICQDSVLKHKEARWMYEKLRTHPTKEVSRKAKQFASSFLAVEFLKVSDSNFPSMYPDYQEYFNAFVSDRYYGPEGEVEEGVLSQALPYLFFLVSPIFVVLILAVQKQHMN